MLRIASDLLAEETKMGMKDVRNRATKSAKPPAGRTKTDGFALSPQNGAAGTASLGFRTWRVMGSSERSPLRP